MRNKLICSLVALSMSSFVTSQAFAKYDEDRMEERMREHQDKKKEHREKMHKKREERKERIKEHKEEIKDKRLW